MERIDYVFESMMRCSLQQAILVELALVEFTADIQKTTSTGCALTVFDFEMLANMPRERFGQLVQRHRRLACFSHFEERLSKREFVGSNVPPKENYRSPIGMQRRIGLDEVMPRALITSEVGLSKHQSDGKALHPMKIDIIICGVKELPAIQAFFFFLFAGFVAAINPGRADVAPEVFGGEGGSLHFAAGEQVICTLEPTMADASWAFASAYAITPPAGASTPDSPFGFQFGADKALSGALRVTGKDGAVDATWNFNVMMGRVQFEALVVASNFTLPQLVGGQWTAGDATGTFPAHFTRAQLFTGEVSTLEITFPVKRNLKFTFPKPTFVVLQDNRQWGEGSFTLRIGRGHGQMAADESYSLEMGITTAGGLTYSRVLPDFMKAVTLEADDNWVPLKEDLDIVAGSALDLRSMGFTDGLCGAKGRIIATSDGHFACADQPDKPKRFYGINLCFGASYLSKDESNRLLDRLVRLGYNAVRIHHYEGLLTGGRPGFDWDKEKVDQLDYLMAGCAKRGIWMTTDLFVSRPVSYQQIGMPGDDRVPMNDYKILVRVYEPAYQDWATFARKFLDRVNPYTGKRVADDPALAWISLINEGPVSNEWNAAQKIPEWTVAWNRWLAARYATRDDLAAAIGDLGTNEDPKQNTVALPQYLNTTTPRSRVGEVFVAATEKSTYERMRDFLRNDIKCPALLTNMNDSGPDVVPLEGTRSDYDYVDEHFYVDHPQFLQKPWNLPSFCSNANPVAAGAPGSSAIATIRLYNKPFTVTEFNYAGPSRFRGVGGVLTGAMAALQDWDALWRFDYGADEQHLFVPGPLHYFDLVSDPLNQAADRLAVLLFLRGDVAVAPHRAELIVTRKMLEDPRAGQSLSSLQAAVWNMRVGGLVWSEPPVAASDIPNHDTQTPIETGGATHPVADAVPVDKSNALPISQPLQSETGEITIDPADSVLTIDTPKSAGGYAEAGKTIESPKAGVRVDGLTTGATVFVNSLDDAPIKSSKRLLVTHLTDLQNTAARFGEGAHQTLLAWGGLPHLVRDGSATVHVTLADPASYSVWALSTGGKRLEKVETKVDAGQLVFTANVRGPDGARMLYEIAQQ